MTNIYTGRSNAYVYFCIFVDTSAWISVMDRAEKRHQLAKDYYSGLLKKRMKFITSNYVLSETYTRIRYDASHHLAVRFHHLIIAACKEEILHIEWVTEKIADKAWEIFEKYDDQELFFADCTSFVVAKESNVSEVFAFDEHFLVMGFITKPMTIK